VIGSAFRESTLSKRRAMAQRLHIDHAGTDGVEEFGIVVVFPEK
jgi:hypothetical protein